jgi:hypothetical protein
MQISHSGRSLATCASSAKSRALVEHAEEAEARSGERLDFGTSVRSVVRASEVRAFHTIRKQVHAVIATAARIVEGRPAGEHDVCDAHQRVLALQQLPWRIR